MVSLLKFFPTFVSKFIMWKNLTSSEKRNIGKSEAKFHATNRAVFGDYWSWLIVQLAVQITVISTYVSDRLQLVHAANLGQVFELPRSRQESIISNIILKNTETTKQPHSTSQ